MDGSNSSDRDVDSDGGGVVKQLIILLFIQAYAYDMLQNSIWRHINELNFHGVKRAFFFFISSENNSLE